MIISLVFFNGGGCNKVNFAFTNTVRYFRNRHSKMNLAALDLTKTFGRVNQFDVLQRLLESGFPLKLINVFCQWYRNIKITFVRKWISFEIDKCVLQVVQKYKKLYFMGL